MTDSKSTDAELVERYLGTFLAWAEQQGPNNAIGCNARVAAEAMVATAREEGRRAGIVVREVPRAPFVVQEDL